jgi:hypothetical protein
MDLLGGLLLWGGALAVRILTTLAVAGIYRWLRPEQLTWSWILRAAWLSFPGTLAVATLAASASPASPELGGPLASLLLPALCLSLLVEGSSASLAGGRELASAAGRRWEQARGRRIAWRAARRALRVLEEQGELDELTQAEKDDLLLSLGQQEKLVDLELEDLAVAHPGPAEKARAAALYEALQASIGALEQAARWGILSRATCDGLRPEILEWLRRNEKQGRDTS